MMSKSLVAKFPREMFFISYHHFRQIMCSTKYTLQQKDTAFGDLATDYVRCKIEDSDIVIFAAILEEWSRRRGWEMFAGDDPGLDEYNMRP